MKKLSIYISEIIIESSTSHDPGAYIIKTYEDTLEFFGITDENSDQAKLIKFMWEKAPQDKDGNKISPFVGDYKKQSKGGPRSFACRRWVSRDIEIMEKLDELGGSFADVFNKDKDDRKSEKFKFSKYHNTSLESSIEFPNSTEYEYIIALSLNIKSLGKDKARDALKYALFGDTEIKFNDQQKEIFDQYYSYYENNIKKINSIADSYELEDGELFTKCLTRDVKSDVQDTWKDDGNYKKHPNSTPKADLISNKGAKLSLKKSTGAQAMSGGINETMATLMTYSYLLDDNNQKKLESLFVDDNGNDIDWSGRNSERNKKLNEILKDIFGNKEANKKFIIAVLTESIAGSAKFGKESKGTATDILTWTPDGKIIKDDVKTYICKIFNNISKDSVTINHKSSGSTWACMRLYLPKYDNSHFEKDNDIFDIVDSVTNNEEIIKRIQGSEDAEVEDDVTLKDKNGKRKKVTIKIGPRGGRYYINSSHNKVYVEKSGNHYVIKKK